MASVHGHMGKQYEIGKYALEYLSDLDDSAVKAEIARLFPKVSQSTRRRGFRNYNALKFFRDESQINKAMAKRQKQPIPPYDFTRARIEKIHFNKEIVKIKFSLEVGGRRAFFDLKDEDAPHPNFMKSLLNLKDDVASWVEVSQSKENEIVVHEIRLKHVDENIGFKVIAYRAIQNARSPLKIDTPLKWIEHPDDKQKLGEDVVERLNEAVFEASQYLLGKRGQLSIFGTGSKNGNAEITESEPEPELEPA